MSPSFKMLFIAAIGTFGVTLRTLTVERLYACGDDQVRKYRLEGSSATETWRWSAAEARDLHEVKGCFLEIIADRESGICRNY